LTKDYFGVNFKEPITKLGFSRGRDQLKNFIDKVWPFDCEYLYQGCWKYPFLRPVKGCVKWMLITLRNC